MKVTQITVKNKERSSKVLNELFVNQPQLGFVFSSIDTFSDADFFQKLKLASPGTQWVGCSTAGEVSQMGVTDETTILTTVRFDNPKSTFKIITSPITAEQSLSAGQKVAQDLLKPDLKSVLLFSPGINVNGSDLVHGASSVLGKAVTLTGGLAGDGGKFATTRTLSPNGISDNQVVAIGFYGDSIQLQHGCMGGWDPFGKTRKVTKSKANVLYELDGKPALEIYKEYLGVHAKDLPGSGLMFPFALLKENEAASGLIRTILAVSEMDGSLTMAGNVDQGSTVRLMHANTEGLVQGAKTAAEYSIKKGQGSASLAVIVSCVGRKLVMGANVDEEVEAVADVFGSGCTMTGFYSYGEISPYMDAVNCDLHNQTMTISYIYEK